MAGGATPGARLLRASVRFQQPGLDVQGDYWVFKGFEIKNAGDNCIGVSGSHNTFDQR